MPACSLPKSKLKQPRLAIVPLDTPPTSRPGAPGLIVLSANRRESAELVTMAKNRTTGAIVMSCNNEREATSKINESDYEKPFQNQ